MSDPKRLRFRQLTPTKVAIEKSPFRICSENPKDNRWIAALSDEQDKFAPMFEIKTPKSVGKVGLKPWMVAQAVAPQCAARTGLLFLTEYTRGLATFSGIFHVGHVSGLGYEVCVRSSDHERAMPRDVIREAREAFTARLEARDA